MTHKIRHHLYLGKQAEFIVPHGTVINIGDEILVTDVKPQYNEIVTKILESRPANGVFNFPHPVYYKISVV